MTSEVLSNETGTRADPIDALEGEQDQLEDVLLSLDEAAGDRASACEGWNVTDVVLHLAQTEEMVAASITGEGDGWISVDSEGAATIDDLMQRWVQAERTRSLDEARYRWMSARRDSVAALRSADPSATFAWAAAPLKAKTLATTRLSEHWIHALDVSGPLEISYPDSDRLWHIARLAHRTIPYAYMRASRADPPSVHIELKGPSGDTWSFGDADAEVHIDGEAGELCRVAARRMSPADAKSLRTTGDRADEVLSLIRTYA